MRPVIYEPARSDNWSFFRPTGNAVQLNNLLNPGLARAPTNPVAIGWAPVNNQPFITARYVPTPSPKNERLTRLFIYVTIVFDEA